MGKKYIQKKNNFSDTGRFRAFLFIILYLNRTSLSVFFVIQFPRYLSIE